jgi:excisionase family DNA binding protein
VIETLPKLHEEEEVANHLGISKYTLRRMVTRGEIRAKKVGRTWKFTDAMVSEYLDGRGTTCNATNSSESSGSHNGPVDRPGTSPGSIGRRDKLDARARAQAILTRPSGH